MLENCFAKATDSQLISAHRMAMFAAMGGYDGPILEEMYRACGPWLKRMIEENKYVGVITEDRGRPVASAGLLILDWPPHPFDPRGEKRGYILNVFVEPEYRHRGLARSLVERCMEEARVRNIRVMALHASDAGRPIYEKLGFRSSNEMIYAEPGKP